MAKIILTETETAFIKANYLKISSSKMALQLGYSTSFVKTTLKRLGLKIPKEITQKFRTEALLGKTTFTEAESEFIKANYLKLPVKTLAGKLNRSYTGVSKRIEQLGLVIPRDIIEQRKKDSQFNKGQKSWNKGKKQADYMSAEMIERTKIGRFKKGDVPHNYNGGEHISKDGYIVLAMGEGKQKLKHINAWEQVNGPLPEGYCLRCIDGNIKNTNPDNWELITREENMLRNTIHRYPKELIKAIRYNSQINKRL